MPAGSPWHSGRAPVTLFDMISSTFSRQTPRRHLASKAAWFALAFCVPLIVSCATHGPYPDDRNLEPIGAKPVFSGAVPPSGLRILVLSDVHGYDVDKLTVDRKLWDAYIERRSKAVDESFANVAAALAAAETADRVDFAVLSGDLTFEGERVGHEALAAALADFERSGVPAFVTTGNHDVNSPQALFFGAKASGQAASVSPRDFETIYAAFGFAEAASKDAESLSYAAEPVPGVVLVVLDTARWYDNAFIPFRISAIGGAVRPGTLKWLEGVLAAARSAGATIVAVQHHPPALAASGGKGAFPGSAEVMGLFDRFGVSIVIAGHKHRFGSYLDEPVPLVLAANVASSPGNSLMVELARDGITLIRDPFGLDPDAGGGPDPEYKP